MPAPDKKGNSLDTGKMGRNKGIIEYSNLILEWTAQKKRSGRKNNEELCLS